MPRIKSPNVVRSLHYTFPLPFIQLKYSRNRQLHMTVRWHGVSDPTHYGEGPDLGGSCCQRCTVCRSAHPQLQINSVNYNGVIFTKCALHKPWNVTDRHSPILRFTLAILLFLFAAFRLLAGGGIVRHFLQRPVGFFNTQLPQFFG